MITQSEALEGLQRGRRLRVDRKDAPLLPWLLAHPQISNRTVEVDDQYGYVEFWWAVPETEVEMFLRDKQ